LSIRSKENKRETWPFSHGVIPLLILAKSDNFMHRYMDYMIVKSDNMKATTVFKLLALTLIFVFIIGPTTAATSGQEALIAGYIKSSMSNHANIINPNLSVFTDTSAKPIFEKNLSQFVTAEQGCSKCALKNATKTWNSVLGDQYNSVITAEYSKKFSGFYFGAAAGAPAGGGGGCCG
jgi:hypothetical protein